jgi:hypothetical protein
MNEDLQRRQRDAAIRQARCRQSNETAVREARESMFLELVCECWQNTCSATLSMSVEEYEEVRRVPTRFIVASGHVNRLVEQIVEDTAAYMVIEKIEMGAKVAATLDPRRVTIGFRPALEH